MTGQAIGFPRRTLSDFVPGAVLEQQFVVRREEVAQFAGVSGDDHPLHWDVQFSLARGYRDVLVQGMLVTSRCSAFVVRSFVGSHGLLVSIASDFRQPVFCDEPLLWRGEVLRVVAEASTVEVRWQVTNQHSVVVQRGTACAWLPTTP